MQTPRLIPRAALLAAVLAATAAAFAAAGEARSSLPVAPASACAASQDPAASAVDQQRAVICLINWTRRQAGLPALRRSRALTGAAAAKARDIDTCNQFAHTPCGMPVFKRIKARLRAGAMGETLYAGDPGDATAYAAYRAWLGSPGHRRVLLGRWFRAAGARVAQVADLEGAATMRVWVVAVADRR